MSNFGNRYRNDRVAFAHDCFTWPDGEQPTAYQDDILGLLDTSSKLAVCGPRGIGKDWLAAITALHFALTIDPIESRPGIRPNWKCVTTAPTWRQLKHFLWAEIHKWSGRLKLCKLGDHVRMDLLDMNITTATGEIVPISATSEMFNGIEADRLMFILNEAKHISNEVFDSIEGQHAISGIATTLALSTPQDEDAKNPSRFSEIILGSHAGWTIRRVSLDEVLRAGRIHTEWVNDRRLQWGAESTLFRNHVLGEFATVVS